MQLRGILHIVNRRTDGCENGGKEEESADEEQGHHQEQFGNVAYRAEKCQCLHHFGIECGVGRIEHSGACHGHFLVEFGGHDGRKQEGAHEADDYSPEGDLNHCHQSYTYYFAEHELERFHRRYHQFEHAVVLLLDYGGHYHLAVHEQEHVEYEGHYQTDEEREGG